MIPATGWDACYANDQTRPVICWAKDESGAVVGMVQLSGHARLVPADVIGAGQFECYAANRSLPISVTPATNPTVARFKTWAAPVEFWGVNVWGEAHAWVINGDDYAVNAWEQNDFVGLETS
jgi:hypothetical protein